LLQNPTLARQVVLTLDLPNNQSFFGGPAQSGFFDSLRRLFSTEKSKKANEPAATQAGLSVATETESKIGALTPEQIERLEVYEDAIIGGEIIEPVLNTNLVKIMYRHPDPDLAQKIANSLAD